MHRIVLLILILIAGLLLVGLAAPALANGNDARDGGGSDHDRARQAVSQDGAQPLAIILPTVEGHYHARMVDLDLEDEGGRLVYEMELITASGRIIEVVVDAATGSIVSDDLDDDDESDFED